MEQDERHAWNWLTGAIGGLTNAHYGVVAGSFALTIVVWLYASSQAQLQAEAKFDRQSDQILELTIERMQKYEDGLWAGVAVVYVNGGQIALADWRSFALTLQIDVKYPGINGIGVIMKVPQSELSDHVLQQRAERPFYDIKPQLGLDVAYPITFIEPQVVNVQAVGLDVAFEAQRFAGLMAARDSGEARITGPITLVQDERSTPGFLFFAPFYQGGFQSSQAARQRTFAGAIYSPFVVEKLMQGVLDREKRDIWIKISDGSDVIYDEHVDDATGADPTPMFKRHAVIPMFGRSWTVDLRTTLDFRAQNSKSQPRLILICGIMIDILLLFLFSSMARSNKRIYSYADQVTQALQREKRELVATNEALEQFSYVAAHDLRTPLRGMRDLTDYLFEGLQESHPGILEYGEARSQFDSLQSLIERMDSLVTGVLECAQLTNKPMSLVEFSSGEIIANIAKDIGLSFDRLTLQGEFPELLFSPTLFNQIFHNLLSNAVGHCDAPPELRVTVRCVCRGNDAVFTVADNGPGIDPQHHDRIFNMFQSLNPERSPLSTGVGLAIVQKAVKLANGEITVSSSLGKGATFTVTFPAIVSNSLHFTAAE